MKLLVKCARVRRPAISRNVSGLCCVVDVNCVLYYTNLFELSPGSSVSTGY